jgi:predicted site-specific integrase-resolvase
VVRVLLNRREALYVRVSGTRGQESSLAAQEAELRTSACGAVIAVFKDRASGLRESHGEPCPWSRGCG